MFLPYTQALHWVWGNRVREVLLAGAATMDVFGRSTLCHPDYKTPRRPWPAVRVPGCRNTQLKAVSFFQVSGPIDESGAAWLAELVRDEDILLVVIDSASESLSAEGYDENSSGDVTRWVSYLPRPFAGRVRR